MSKKKKSGVAVFLYYIIALSAITAAISLSLYYGGCSTSPTLLWVGIVSFMIMYHLWLRIIMGNVSKLVTIDLHNRWFTEMPFEKKLYRLLRVKRWKKKALTYNPEAFSLKNHSLEEIADTMCKSELDHWINEVISLTAVLFSLIWGKAWLFGLTSLAAMAFDAQFIIIQRYNRPRILRILKKSSTN